MSVKKENTEDIKYSAHLYIDNNISDLPAKTQITKELISHLQSDIESLKNETLYINTPAQEEKIKTPPKNNRYNSPVSNYTLKCNSPSIVELNMNEEEVEKTLQRHEMELKQVTEQQPQISKKGRKYIPLKTTDAFKYPTYGRGIDPALIMDSYMINARLNPTTNVGNQPCHVMSPDRRRFEEKYKNYLKKYDHLDHISRENPLFKLSPNKVSKVPITKKIMSVGMKMGNREKKLFILISDILESISNEEGNVFKTSLVNIFKTSPIVNDFFNISNFGNFEATLLNTSDGDYITWDQALSAIMPYRRPLVDEKDVPIAEKKSPKRHSKELDVKENEKPQTEKVKPAEGEFKVTVPKPFEFEHKKKKTTIRQRRLAEMLEEKRLAEEELRHYKIPLVPVPESLKRKQKQ
jgi:hypothetical protein